MVGEIGLSKSKQSLGEEDSSQEDSNNLQDQEPEEAVDSEIDPVSTETSEDRVRAAEAEVERLKGVIAETREYVQNNFREVKRLLDEMREEQKETSDIVIRKWAETRVVAITNTLKAVRTAKERNSDVLNKAWNLVKKWRSPEGVAMPMGQVIEDCMAMFSEVVASTVFMDAQYDTMLMEIDTLIKMAREEEK